MGEASLRLAKEARTVTLDFSAANLAVSSVFANLGTNEAGDSEGLRIARLLLSNLVNRQWPQGLNRHDGKLWSAWEELLDEGAPDKTETTVAVLAWAQKLVNDEKLTVAPFLAGPREAFSEYLDTAIKAAKEAEGGAV